MFLLNLKLNKSCLSEEQVAMQEAHNHSNRKDPKMEDVHKRKMTLRLKLVEIVLSRVVNMLNTP